MILAAIEIDNYKQYQAAQRIDFPEQGLVSVTGPNGAGKTTLFEAIEWCLYGPRTIPLPSIPPRDGIGATTVRVILEDPHDGRRFVVQRSLRNGLSSAEVYAEDAPGQPLVQGPRDVNDFVAKQLIGLPHAAFVSTFFTRQKELTFFGDRPPTERRVEVGRLLGFQTIREAQEELAGERNVARHAAMSMQAQYDRESADRDFSAEVATAERALDAAHALEAATTLDVARAEAESERTRTVLDRWRDLQERDNALGAAFADIAGQMAAATSRREAAEAELLRLDERGTALTALLPDAAAVAVRSFEVSLLDEQRQQDMRARALHDLRRDAADRLALVSERLRLLVEEHADTAGTLEGWSWSVDDGDRPEVCALRLRNAVSGVDPGAARSRVELLLRAQECMRIAAETAETLRKYREHHDKLAARREKLRAGGDPQTALMAAQEAIRQAQDARVNAKQQLARARKSREDAERLARELRGRAREPICPTCARPLGGEEAERLARLLDADAKRLLGQEREFERQDRAASQLAQDAARQEEEARRLQDEVTTLDARIADGVEKTADTVTMHERARVSLQEALDAVAMPAPPGATDIETARQVADKTQRIADMTPYISQYAHQAEEARAALINADREIADLGPITYDEAAHKQAQTALDAAREAEARVKEIEKELSRRPRYEEQRDAANDELAAMTVRKESVMAERGALGFDVAALRSAVAEEASAREAARAARDEHGAARESLREAQAALRRVVAVRDRLLRLAEEADRQRREADELDRMYKEFGEFDRYVADHVGPLLAETTERLLSLVTDGKYDHVRFDENYGIEVFDRDEAFKLDGFSGGERDVVALCARLAMSELVGSAALRPPRFLVLDEVFGSLDSERRAQLLSTLGSLASAGHFQQMFIISHVDDVQQSPAMNEAWTIEERDGVSRVNRPEALAVTSA
jgi:exonuclease SbcC